MKTNFQFKIFNFQISLLLFTFYFLFFTPFAWGYPLDNTDNSGAFSGLGTNQTNQIGSSLNELIKSIFGYKTTVPNILGISSSDINKFIPKGYGLTFEDLVNVKSFSTKDISGTLKAVTILFIKLVVTTLSVTLGILKLVLSLLTQG